jgi:hypothetical protein
MGQPANTRAWQARVFDCHSNETVWPLYARVAPVSWLLMREVREGRNQLNFSEWRAAGGHEQQKKARESDEKIMEDEMPPRAYLLLHPEARLTPQEKAQLSLGLQKSLR